MHRLALVLCSLTLLTAVAAVAQAPPTETPQPPVSQPQPLPAPAGSEQSEPQSGRVFCGQTVSYQLADPATVPEDARRFVGVWSDAAWDPRTCAALIVENVGPDGTASIMYIVGPQGANSPVQGQVLHGTGVIRDGELRFQNSDGTQFAFRPGLVDMTGHMINPQGESFEATFKETP
jgi:hypothetical protein